MLQLYLSTIDILENLVGFTVQAISIWMVLLVTLDRYSAVCMPHQIQRISLFRAKVSAFVILFIACIFPLQFYFFNERFF